jgi:predicted RNA-binding protein YlqC (UPF0109 family)
MGQKVHPESMRVGYIHDWKSNWFSERNFADYLIEDVRVRKHILGRLSHAGLSQIAIRKNASELTVNIHTARPGIVIGKSGSEVDALRRDLHKLTDKQVKVNILEVKRPELDAMLVDALGCQGREDPGFRSSRRRRHGAHRAVPRRPRAATHDSRRHRLRLLGGAHDIRPDRREVLDQQGRDHARGLRQRSHPDRRAQAFRRR